MKETIIKNVPNGMKLVENEKKVNAITKALIRCEGFCPCVKDSIGKQEYKCPCLHSRNDNECCCGLYEKE